jgi:hypothetical protein
VALVLASGFQQPPSNRGEVAWLVFNSKEGAFTVLMPNNPTQETQSIDTDLGKMESHLASCAFDDRAAFIASYCDFPQVVTEQTAINRILDGARNQLLASERRKLLSETRITLDGYFGREIRIEIPEWSMVTRIYWVKRRLYQLIAMTRSDQPAPRNEERFLASFKLQVEVTASLQEPRAWIELASEQGGFTVLMPGKPTEQVMPVPSATGSLEVHIYVSLGQEGIAYMASYSDLPSAPADQSQVIRTLDEVRNGQLKKAKGKLLNEITISLDGNPGRELKIETAVGPMIVRIFLVNRRLYQVLAVIPETAAGTEAVVRDTAKFLSSFKVVIR